MSATSSARSLQEGLCCSLCLEYFTEPVVIECGHSFCRACIVQHWEKWELMSPCPQCGEISLKRKFTPSRDLENMVQIAKRMKAESEKVEKVCGLHQEPLKHFCKSEQKLLCDTCVESNEHNATHVLVAVEEAIQDYKKELETQLQDWREKRATAISFHEKEQDKCQNFLRKVDAEKKKIMSQFEEVQQFLKQQEETMLDQLEEFVKEEQMCVAKLSGDIFLTDSMIHELEEKSRHQEKAFLQDVEKTFSRCELWGSQQPDICSELEEKLHTFSKKYIILKQTLLEFKENFPAQLEVEYASIPLPDGSHAIRILQTTIFQNPTITDFEIIALLGDVETHTADSHTGKISFLQPWANSGLKPDEWKRLEKVAKIYFIGFNRTVHTIIQDMNISYPAVAQSLVFCEIQPDGTTRGYYDAAGNRKALVTFSGHVGMWTALNKDPAALSIADFLNQNKGTLITMQSLFSQCFKVLRTFLQTGKAAVERQELPVAIVFARESPTDPDSLMLVCRVTGFYPHSIKVSWLQDEKKMPDSSMVNSTEILPNHDLTYQIRSSLMIPSADIHGYSCKVEHSSLGGENLVIPWKRRKNLKTGVIAGLICGVVIIASIAAAALYLWWRKHREYEDFRGAPAVI